jgi:hypothetical protein
MNLLLIGVLVLPLGCLALLTFLALLGVLTLAGALRGVGAIRASVGEAGRGLVDDGIRSIIEGSPSSDEFDHIKERPPWHRRDRTVDQAVFVFWATACERRNPACHRAQTRAFSPSGFAWGLNWR